MNFTIYENVIIGENKYIGLYSIVGMPPRGKSAGQLQLKIGNDCTIRPFNIIYAGSKIGNFFQTGSYVSIRENNIIGNNVSVGTGSTLEIENVIGNNVRIHSNCFLELAVIENNVFIGPNVVMIDDPHPPCPKYKKCKGGVTIGENTKIGAGSILLPGVKIGKNVLVAAGSLVTKNIPNDVVIAGSPAKVIKQTKDLKCIKGFFEKPYVWEN